MAARNAADTLPTAIRSITAQSYTNFQISVIVRADDIDTTQAAKLMSEDDSRIVILVQNGTGISNARNEALNSIKCDLFAFLDSDDSMAPGMLARIVQDYRSSERSALRFLDWSAFDPTTGESTRRVFSPGYTPTYRALVKANFIATCVAVVDSSVIYDVGIFDERYAHAEDWDLWLRIAKKYPLVHISYPGAVYTRTKLTRIYPRSFFEDEVRIIKSQLLPTLLRSYCIGLARGRYGAYWLQTLKSRKTMRELFDIRLTDLLWVLPVALTRFSRFTA